MAHKKRIRCCRSTPRCDDCPVIALHTGGKPTRGSKKPARRRRPR